MLETDQPINSSQATGLQRKMFRLKIRYMILCVKTGSNVGKVR